MQFNYCSVIVVMWLWSWTCKALINVFYLIYVNTVSFMVWLVWKRIVIVSHTKVERTVLFHNRCPQALRITSKDTEREDSGENFTVSSRTTAKWMSAVMALMNSGIPIQVVDNSDDDLRRITWERLRIYIAEQRSKRLDCWCSKISYGTSWMRNKRSCGLISII